MNRALGTSFLILLALAWQSRTNPPAEAVAPQGAEGSQQGAAASRLAHEAGARLLLQHFGTARPSVDVPADVEALARNSSLDVLIATIPDPLASHLDWAFDSHLDALRRAFERAGYVLDRFELPWSAADAKDSDSPGLPGSPGAVLFRRSARVEDSPTEPASSIAGAGAPSLWLVYLIGELSTGGIDRAAFRKALQERAALLGSSPDAGKAVVRIVGPVFSGSSSSLNRALLEARVKDVQIVSGAATSPQNDEMLRRGASTGIWFESTLHTDATLLDVLEHRILPGLGLCPSDVVLLKESTTDYGQSAGLRSEDSNLTAKNEDVGCARDSSRAKADGDRVEKFSSVPFPMSIGTLRQAIEKSSAEQGGASSTPARTGRRNVGLDVYDEPPRAETTFTASKLTPPSIDLLLEEITRTLAQRDVRAVVILASDVRDKLFLGSEIKKRLPDVQLITTESNILYLRPEFNRWLRGMIVLSTYPLLLPDSSWRPQSSTVGEQLMFPNEGAEGTFNAVLRQLGRNDLLADYGFPVGARPSDKEGPPVWATVVGAGTMLPLAVYPWAKSGATTPVAVDAEPPAKDPAPKPGASTGAASESHRSFLAMLGTSVFSFFVLCTVSVGWLRERRRSDQRSGRLSDRILAALPPGRPVSWEERQDHLERVSLALHHELYTAFLYVSLLSLLLPNILLLHLGNPLRIDGLLLARILGYTAVVVGTLALVERSVRAIGIATRHGISARDHLFAPDWPRPWLKCEWFLEIFLRGGVVLLSLAYIASTIFLGVEVVRLKQDTRDLSRFQLFFHRAIELDQGVSPLVPLALVGAVLVAWCFWHLRRIRDLATRLPAEGALHASTTFERPFSISDVRDRLFRIVPSTEGFPLFLALGCSVVWLAMSFGSTLDGLVLSGAGTPSAFDVLLCAGILGALSGSVWAGYRLVAIWFSFAATLHENDVVLAAIPFASVKRELGVRADLGLWPGGQRRNLARFARSRWSELGRAIEGAPNELRKALAPAAEVAARTDNEQFAEDRAALTMIRTIMEHLQTAEGVGPTPRDRAPWRKAMEQVVAVEMLRYVDWVVKHLRRLSTFLVLALIGTTLLISSYPYRPQQLIQTIALFLFAAIVVCLVGLIGAMNRNAGLSQMALTEPGELTWDRTLFANLALYGLVPLITLISTQYAGMRETLFDWIKPLMQFLVKA